jgi:diguanylate cyclase (GGDEF)-like protein
LAAYRLRHNVFVNQKDPLFLAHSFNGLLPIAVRVQIIAAVCHGLALVLALCYRGPVSFEACLLVCTTAGAPALTSLSGHFWQLRLTGLLTVLSMAIGIPMLLEHSVQPYMWLLPIGLCVTLSSAAVYHSVAMYLLMAAAVWGILLYWLLPALANPLEVALALLVILGSTSAGATISVMFRALRWKSFILQRQLHVIANVDVLTELPNRRAFLGRLDELLAQAQESGGLYFLMLDVDDFKTINDQYGHDVGDSALIAVARTVAQTVAASVANHGVGRMGGEEFAVAALMHEAEAHALACNILLAVRDCQLQGRHLSISIGMALRQPDEPVRSLMRRADLALYGAKLAGKNQYVLAP